MGTLILVVLLMVETLFLIWTIKTDSTHREEKNIINIGLFGLILIFFATGILEWSFRYSLLMLYMTIVTIYSVYRLLKKKEKAFFLHKSIKRFIFKAFILFAVTAMAIVFPQYKQIESSGPLEVATEKFTWVDESRQEIFSENKENRAVTVDFWYPNNEGGKYPLVIFSHGAFGFSGSNYTTFTELASQGYVVASISHTYQAFYTKDTSGKVTIVDPEFISKASEINGKHDTRHEAEVYEITREWMELRTQDENFVIESILKENKDQRGHPVFSRIDVEKIGLMGHSLGGATSAEVGRMRSDIDAVIVLDGTMLGEEIDFQNQSVVFNSEPYPVPLLNIYAEDHYENAMQHVGESYNNFNVTQNAVEAYETVFKGAGHLNFTDLPLFSPFLAKQLGVGDVDARDCIKSMNHVVLSFFDAYLKNGTEPIIEKEY